MTSIILVFILLILITLAIIVLNKLYKNKNKEIQNLPDSYIHSNIVAINEDPNKEPGCPICGGKNNREQLFCSLCGFDLHYVVDDFTIVAYRYYIPSIKEIYRYKRMERFIIDEK